MIIGLYNHNGSNTRINLELTVLNYLMEIIWWKTKNHITTVLYIMYRHFEDIKIND